MRLATTIEEVIEMLDVIISSEIQHHSHLVFFPILYRKVTRRIALGIANQEFDNNDRMEKLDVIFANRYLVAYHLFKNGETPTQSWLEAFTAAKNKKLIILQHLLLGINAHINLDLGIAVVETVGKNGDLPSFQGDFNKINAILSSMVNNVQEGIGKVSPLFYLLEKVGKGKEDKVATFSINLARDGAWLFANQYYISPLQDDTLQFRDGIISVLATKLTTTKSRVLRWTIKVVRWFETKNVSKVAEVLNS